VLLRGIIAGLVDPDQGSGRWSGSARSARPRRTKRRGTLIATAATTSSWRPLTSDRARRMPTNDVSRLSGEAKVAPDVPGLESLLSYQGLPGMDGLTRVRVYEEPGQIPVVYRRRARRQPWDAPDRRDRDGSRFDPREPVCPTARVSAGLLRVAGHPLATPGFAGLSFSIAIGEDRWRPIALHRRNPFRQRRRGLACVPYPHADAERLSRSRLAPTLTIQSSSWAARCRLGRVGAPSPDCLDPKAKPCEQIRRKHPTSRRSATSASRRVSRPIVAQHSVARDTCGLRQQVIPVERSVVHCDHAGASEPSILFLAEHSPQIERLLTVPCGQDPPRCQGFAHRARQRFAFPLSYLCAGFDS
jgi:hypothetical protein